MCAQVHRYLLVKRLGEGLGGGGGAVVVVKVALHGPRELLGAVVAARSSGDVCSFERQTGANTGKAQQAGSRQKKNESPTSHQGG